MATTVTSQIQGITISESIKAPVATVSATNLVLSGYQTVGGVTITAASNNKRTLVCAQNNAIENGIYDQGSSGWQRSKDFDGNRDVVQGTLVLTNDPDVAYRVVTPNRIVIGTSAITFEVAGLVLSQAAFNTLLSASDPYKRTSAEILAGVTPLNFAFPENHILRYLAAFVSDSTDCTAAIQNLLSVLRMSKGVGYFPAGIYRYTSTISMDTAGMCIEGAGKVQTTLKKMANFVGFTVTASCSLRDFTLDRSGSDTNAGITIRNQARVDFRDLIIQNQGSHGLWPQQTSLSIFDTIQLVSNGGDGLRLDATVAPTGANSYVNANWFSNIDARGNASHGINFVEAYSNYGYGLTTQNNGGDGLRLDNARANSLTFYSEANAGNELTLTSNVNCRGNILYSVQDGGVSNSSTAGSNMIFRPNSGGTYEAHFQDFKAQRWIIPENSAGGAFQGTLTAEHIADRDFAVTLDGFSGSQTLRLRNAQSGGLNVVTDRLELDTIRLKAVAPAVSVAQVGLGSTTSSTVGSAGGGSPLPANPTGYWIINIAGTAYKIPYYAS